MNKRVLQPKVGIVVSNFNYSMFISDCITSIIEQSYSNLDVVVVDDRSTDNSVEIINSLAQKHKIKVHVNEVNSGQTASLRNGLALLDKDVHFVQFVDADDILCEDCCRDLLNVFLNVDPEYSVVAGFCNLIDRDGYVFAVLTKGRRLTGDFEIVHPTQHKFPCWPVHSATSGIMFRKLAAELILNHECSSALRISTDFLLVNTLYLLCGCINLNKVVFSYRLHGNNGFMGIGNNGQLTPNSDILKQSYRETFKVARSILQGDQIPIEKYPAFAANFLTEKEFMNSGFRFKDFMRVVKYRRRSYLRMGAYTARKLLGLGSTTRNALGVNTRAFLKSNF